MPIGQLARTVCEEAGTLPVVTQPSHLSSDTVQSAGGLQQHQP